MWAFNSPNNAAVRNNPWTQSLNDPNYFSHPPYQQPNKYGYGPWPKRGEHPHNKNASRKNSRPPKKDSVTVGHCDVCDRGFKNEEKKKEHFRQHVKCSEPGCKFEAHFKIVAIHKRNVHGSNPIRIQLETQEEIEAWREERKRKYPSRANVELKAKRVKERHEMGNILETQSFAKMRQNRGRRNDDFRSCVEETDQITMSKPSMHSNGQKAKSMSCNLLESDSVQNDDNSDGDNSTETAPQPVVKADTSGALGSLMDAYESEDEDENSNAEVSAPARGLDSLFESVKAPKDKPCEHGHSHSNALFNDRTIFLQNSPERPRSNSKAVSLHRRKNLLEMLLAPDIRRERNQVLQCVRYIVKSNFFDGSAQP